MKQREVLEFVMRCQRESGYPPTVREIMRHFGFRSPRAASDHLAALERKGYLERLSRAARGIRVLSDMEDTETAEGIPIVGDVAAGLPILATENILGTLSLEDTFGNGELFAVRVRGDSMIDHGIYEGDLVIVRRTPEVKPGTIAVVYLEGEATVKTLAKTREGYELIAGNSRYSPIRITADTPGFAVAGPVVGVIRKI